MRSMRPASKLDGSKSIDDFITACRKLRFWKREETVSF